MREPVEMTIAELRAQVGSLLPAREEMAVVFNKGVKISNVGRNSFILIADGDVVFGQTITLIINKG